MLSAPEQPGFGREDLVLTMDKLYANEQLGQESWATGTKLMEMQNPKRGLPKPEPKAKPEAKAEAKPEAKAEAKPEAKAEAQPEAKVEEPPLPEDAPTEKAPLPSSDKNDGESE